MTNLEWALNYAKLGWKIFPCLPDKTPATKNGFYAGTDNEEQIKTWWSENPNYLIGLATGKASGVWVTDFDEYKKPGLMSDFQKAYEPLPQTLMQKTGRGGYHYFWKYNQAIGSRNGVLPYIDIKGDGGYVILPPSVNGDGKAYRWINKAKTIDAPVWLIEIAFKEKDPVNNSNLSGTSNYGKAALADELITISRTYEGNRNDTLNSSAYSLGQLIAGGELERGEVEASLLGAAIAKGLKLKEAKATIKSGIDSGMIHPRSNPHKKDDDFIFDEEVGNQSNQSNQSNQGESDSSAGNQPVIKTPLFGNQSNQDSERNKPHNLHAMIGEWIRNSTGSFTVDQLDREFCLKTRQEKLNRSKSLAVWKEKNIIKKDKNIKGKWYVIDSSVEWVDLAKADDSPFSINLPFDLHKYVSVPQKSIIVLAGTSNAGKTTFLLGTIRMNMDNDYERMYLMSEMGSGLYKRRIQKFGDPISLWQEKVKAAEKSHDFDGMIQNFNPNGLTCIDFLEEVDGEYFKIPTSIRNIYDALGTGCALVAIQKKSQSQYGKGGEATREKACLYITLDLLSIVESEDKRSIYCALKLDKVKESLKGNMEGKELHFRIDDGVKMTVVMDWTYSSRVNRSKCILQYEQGARDEENPYIPYTFKVKEGEEVTLLKKDYLDWKRSYRGYDLDKELRRVSEMSYVATWLTRKSWYWQLGQHLDKKYKEKN